MKEKIKSELYELGLLLKSVPALFFSFFILSVVLMNLFANKSINTPFSWLKLDAGIFISWLSFLSMDVITKHFGYKAGNQLSLIALFINLSICALLFIVGSISGTWSKASNQLINVAIDNTFKGTWYVLLGSTISFVVSSFVNNFINHIIGQFFKKNPNSFLAFISRSYISTIFSQFIDNFTFSLIVSKVFFHWSLTQCLICALFGMLVELMCEIIFSPLGFYISKKWIKDNVGNLYITHRKGKTK